MSARRVGDHVRILTAEIPAQVGEITRTFTDNLDADVLVRALTGITYPARADEIEPLAEPGADYEDDPYVRDVVNEWNDDELDDALPGSTEPLDPEMEAATDGGTEEKENNTMSTIIDRLANDPDLTVDQLAALAAVHRFDPLDVLDRAAISSPTFPVGTRVRIIGDPFEGFPASDSRRPAGGDAGTVVPLVSHLVAREHGLVSVRLDWGEVWTFTRGDLMEIR